MGLQSKFDELASETSTFATTFCYRDAADFDADLLDQTGDVLLLADTSEHPTYTVLKSLHHAVTNDGSLVLIVTPTDSMAHGTILMIEDEMERPLFDDSVWGREKSTRTELTFDNGSRIVARTVNEEVQADKIRGLSPDLLIVENVYEDGEHVPQEAINSAILPMKQFTEQMWMNATESAFGKHVDSMLSDGVYVKRLD